MIHAPPDAAPTTEVIWMPDPSAEHPLRSLHTMTARESTYSLGPRLATVSNDIAQERMLRRVQDNILSMTTGLNIPRTRHAIVVYQLHIAAALLRHDHCFRERTDAQPPRYPKETSRVFSYDSLRCNVNEDDYTQCLSYVHVCVCYPYCASLSPIFAPATLS
jgi:hypothetical protein